LQDGLTAARTAEDCWAAVQLNSCQFGFEVVRMRLASRTFGEPEVALPAPTIRIALSEEDWVDLALDANPGQQPNVLIPFVTTMRRALAEKEISLEDAVSEPHPFSTVFQNVASPMIH